MTDTITDDVLDAILRESDGFWPPARERIQALIREHDAALIEGLTGAFGENQMIREGDVKEWLHLKARQRREEKS